jgi:Cd2+/Zn2+-exporting ATPase
VAIVNEAAARGCATLEAIDAQQVAGHGVRARVNGRQIAVGRREMLISAVGGVVDAASARSATPPPGSNGIDAAITQLGQGQSIVCIAIDEKPAGVIALADQPRSTARDAIARLKRIGIRRTIMLTGDKKSVADAVGKEVGVDEVRAELLPQEKLDLVKSLENEYGPLAMIGDGVNDAPALAAATVGIAMGGAGTDVALETADVALMSDDLSRLPDAIGLSRFSRRIITQNLVIALGVIACLSPLAAMGFTYLGVAVMFHEGSTVVVVLNSLRLLMYKPTQ